MPTLIPYLFKLFISLSLVWLFYRVVLQRITFYTANRWYLLALTLLSFLVPFININPVVNRPEAGTLIRYIPSIQNYSIGLEEATHCPMPLWSTNWNKWDWFMLVMAIGMVVLLLRFLLRYYSFFRLRGKARLVSDTPFKVYQVDDAIIPFSFGNAIFINSRQHTESELREIIHHEFIHVKQKHTIDILWAELLCILNWYNPAAWLLKKSIRQNLEFIADHQVLENGINKKQYQYLLLKVIGNDQFSIAQKFNFSSLKKRIAMMNKTRSRRANLLRFLMLLPLLAVILISFRDQIGDSLSSPPVYTDTIPEVRTPNKKGYIINIRDNKGQCMVEVKDGNGKLVEKMPLTQWQAEEDQLEGKYGEIPPPPPPQPPAPPQPVELPQPPQPANPELPVQPAQPPAPPAPVKKSNELITSAEEFEISDKKATIRLKDGTVEEYDLRNNKERKEFENKWGQIIETNALAPSAIVNLPGGQTVVSPIAPSVAGNGVTVIDPTGAIIGGEEELIITISKYSTKQQLEEYKKEAKAKGVELKYDEIEYNEKGILVKLTGTMKSGTGQSNFVATDFQKLVLAMTRVNGKTWFKVNTSNQKEVSVTFPAKPANKINQSKQVIPPKPATSPLFLPISLFPVEKDKC